MKRYSSSYRSNYKPRSVRKIEQKSKRNIILTILFIIGLCYFLIAWGLPALIGGLSIFHKPTTPSKNTTTNNTAIAPPVLNIPYEATNTATIKISGYASPNSQVEIYIDDNLKDTTTVSDGGSFTSGDLDLSLGTNNIFGKTAQGDSKSLASKTIQLIYNSDKPKLDLTEPQDGLQIKGGDKKIKVSGSTDSSNNISINGLTTIVDNSGNFSAEVPLNDGDNTITVVATNYFGNTTQVQKKVTYSAS